VNRAIRTMVVVILLASGCGGGHAGLTPRDDGGGAGRDASGDGASATGGSSGSPGIDAANGKGGGGGGGTGAGGGGGSAGSGGTRDGGSPGQGGTTDASARDNRPRDSSGDGGCIAGCSTRTPSTFCTGGTVEWVCNGSADLSSFTAACQMVGSGLIRYCCPAAYLAQCQ